MKITVNTKPYNTVISTCIALIFLTSSFDIVANINVYGFNLRLSHILSAFIIMLWLMEGIRRKVRLPVGSGYLCCWIVIQFFFVFRSPNLVNAVGYFIWLVIDVLIIFGIVQYTGKAYSLQWLLQTYLRSFVWISILGLMQFILYAIGIDLFVVQHWTASFARINGFCYEPSYYSTYLLPGFVIYAYLLEKHNEEILPYKEIKKGLLIISAALILSTSRMGWLMMAAWLVLRFGLYFIRLLKRRIHMKMIRTILLLGLIIAIFVRSFLYIVNTRKMSFLLNGLGLFGMAGYSKNGRIENLIRCIEVFMKNPFLGVSLGGVDAQVAKYGGFAYVAGENGGATSLLGEIIVANGILGLIPFIGYMASLVYKRKNMSDSVVLAALRWALVFEGIILCMNQNILREYLWVLIAVLSATEYSLRKKR